MLRHSRSLLLRVINPIDGLVMDQLVLGLTTETVNGRGYINLAQPPGTKVDSIPPRYRVERFHKVLPDRIEAFLDLQIKAVLDETYTGDK